MAKKLIRTFGEARDYTIEYRWEGKRSIKTNLINSKHVLDVIGKNFPLEEMATTGFWRELAKDLMTRHPLWSDSTCNRVLTAGSTILRTVVEDEKATIDRIPKIPRFKEGESRYLYYTKEEVERLVYNAHDPFDNPALGDVILMGAYTGCRITEILNLRVMDIDWGGNLVWVGGMKGRITKGNEVRQIPISDRIEEMLMTRTKGKQDNEKVFGCDWRSYDAVNYWFKKVRSYSGFTEDHCFHCLRHSFATWLAEKASPKQVKDLLGHAQITTTMRYCHASDESLRGAVAGLTAS
jgi:integrase